MKNIENWPAEARTALLDAKKNYADGCGSCADAEWAITSIYEDKRPDHSTGKFIRKTNATAGLILCRSGACIIIGDKLSPVRFCTMHNDGTQDATITVPAAPSDSPLGLTAKPQNAGLSRGVFGLGPDLINKSR